MKTAGNAAKSVVTAKCAIWENAKLASEGRIATGKRFTLQMILLTAGNAVTSAVSAKCAMMENAKRTPEERIATGNILIL